MVPLSVTDDHLEPVRCFGTEGIDTVEFGEADGESKGDRWSGERVGDLPLLPEDDFRAILLKQRRGGV